MVRVRIENEEFTSIELGIYINFERPILNMLHKKLSLLFFFLILFLQAISQSSKGGNVSNTSNSNQPGNTYALIVGVSKYQFPETYKTLDYADDDGRSFYNYLTSNAGGNINKDNIDTLFNENATHGAILEKMLSIKERLQPNDIFYFYFSGHGDAYNAEKAFLLAYDSPSSKGKKEKNHYLTLSGAIDIHTIKIIFKEITAANSKVVFISDACRTNELAGGAEGQGAIFKKIMEEDAGELRFTSCSTNQVSFEGPQWGKGRGLFSYYLINGMIGMADTDPEDGRVSVDELYNYVKSNVKKETYDSLQGLSLQTPQLSCHLTNCDALILNKVNKAERDHLALYLKNNPSGYSNTFAYHGSKGVDLLGEMRKLGKEELYNAFNLAMNDGKLIGSNSATEIFKQIEKDDDIPLKIENEYRGMLSNLLLTDVNRVINIYMNASQNNNLYTPEFFRHPYHELKTFKEIANPLFYNEKDVQVMIYFLEGHSGWKSNKTAELLKSLALIDSAVAINPEAAYLYNIKGVLHYKIKQYKLSEQAFKKGIELAPNWIYPLTNLGSVYSYLGQHDTALVYLRKALELDSSFQLSYLSIANEFNYFGNEDSCMYYINEGLKQDPKDPYLWNYLGGKYYQNGIWDKSMAAYRKSYSYDSTQTIGYEGAMRLHLKNFQHIDSVMFYLNKMIKIDSLNPATYLNVGYILNEFDYDSVALQYFSASVYLDTLNVDAWNACAFIYDKMGDKVTAESLLLKSISIDSSYSTTYNQIGNLYFELGRNVEAILMFKKAIVSNPYQEINYYNVGYVCFESNSFEQAIKYLLLCEEKNPYYKNAFPLLARAYSLQKNNQYARFYLEKSIRHGFYKNRKEVLKEKDYKFLKKDKTYKKWLKELFETQGIYGLAYER